MKGKGKGWKGESRRHSLARKGIGTAMGRIDSVYTNPDTKFNKKEIINKIPKEVTVSVPLNLGKDVTLEEISEYLEKKYSISIDTDTESSYYLDLFYNPDLRSIMGSAEEWDQDFIDLQINPKYYVDKYDKYGHGIEGELNPDGHYSKLWTKLINNSKILEVRW